MIISESWHKSISENVAHYEKKNTNNFNIYENIWTNNKTKYSRNASVLMFIESKYSVIWILDSMLKCLLIWYCYFYDLLSSYTYNLDLI